MKKIYLILLLSFFASCKKDFKVDSFETKKLDSIKFGNSETTKKYIQFVLIDKSHPMHIEKVESLNEFLQKIDKKNNIPSFQEAELNAKVDKYVQNYISEMRNKGSQESDLKLKIVGERKYFESLKPISEKDKNNLAVEVEKEIRKDNKTKDSLYKKVLNQILNKSKYGLQNKLQITNNTEESIESAIITIVVDFKFKNSTKTYLKSFESIKSKSVWKSNEKIILNFDNILNFAENFDEKIFKNHSADKINLRIFLVAKNSVGYNNVKISEIKMKSFGEIYSNEFNAEEISKFGEEIFETDITNIWKK